MGNNDHRTPEIAVWSGVRGLYHACCDCGWDDKPRWFRFRALDRAWAHAAQTGHRLASPLVINLLSAHWPPRPLISRLRRAAMSWPVTVSMLLLIIPVGLFTAPDAAAISSLDRVTVSVAWAGTPTCINAWEPLPANRREVRYGAVCAADRSASDEYFARMGDWVGVDPEMSGADFLACTIAVNGQIVFSDGAARGDGHEVSCLRQWW